MSIRELRSKLQRKGLMGSLRLFTERYLYAHHQLIWFARELHSNPLSLPRRHAWEYVDTRSELLPAFAKHFPGQISVMRDLLAQPDLHGYVALNQQGEVCAYMWISPRDYYDAHYFRGWFPVAAGDAYLFALEVAMAHRGSAVFLGGQNHLWQLLQKRGYRRAVAVVDAHNHLMLRLIRRLGFQPDGRIVHAYTLFGCIRYTRQPAVPILHKQAAGSQPGLARSK